MRKSIVLSLFLAAMLAVSCTCQQRIERLQRHSARKATLQSTVCKKQQNMPAKDIIQPLPP